MTRLFLGAATAVLFLAACEDISDGGGNDPPGGGGSSCQKGCDKLRECLSDTPEAVSDTCVEDCAKNLDDDATTAATRSCLDCVVGLDCAASHDGTKLADCSVDCGG